VRRQRPRFGTTIWSRAGPVSMATVAPARARPAAIAAPSPLCAAGYRGDTPAEAKCRRYEFSGMIWDTGYLDSDFATLASRAVEGVGYRLHAQRLPTGGKLLADSPGAN
jgi:hypothetical protein